MSDIVKSSSMGMVLRPQSFGELIQFANMAAKSKMVPKDFQNQPENIMLAIQMGSELGLAPMQSLQNIAIVNGRPSVWGDALIGLCRQSGYCQSIREWVTGEGDAMIAFCEAIRVGSSPVVQSFSVDDAKRAGLWKTEPKTQKTGSNGTYMADSGPWYSYPKRMLQMRARGFALRDAFPDVLRGLISAEEARDIPASDTFTGTTINAEPVQPQPPPEHKKMTRGETLDMFETELMDAFDGLDPKARVDEIIADKRFKWLEDTSTNGTLERLNGIKKMIFARLAPSEEDPDKD